MAPASRDAELADYLARLTAWAVAAVRTMWTRIDPADVAASFTTIADPLLAVHERLAVTALNAVDDWMTLRAADDGLAYLTTWTEDHPDAWRLTPAGGDVPLFLLATPGYVLWRIRNGDAAEVACGRGLNRVLRLTGAHAAHLARLVTVDRVVADLAAAP
jgi:hypothetical protein